MNFALVIFALVYRSFTAINTDQEDSDDGMYTAVVASVLRNAAPNNKEDNLPLLM